ncbi:hypothetical protein M422DRAFT_158593 [Sphaerobolus stellatus SS14]|nr:hypothetical protein M422DRAFT_158593 [Sphaerobolus stellatus SS14]
MAQNVLQSSRRSKLAGAFSSLKRVRPTVPFWELAAHRIPTIWTLYRGLLRGAKEYENVQWRVGILFRKNQHLTSPQKTTERLDKAYEWLRVFQAAADGDEYSQAVLRRYDSLINARCERIQMEQTMLKEKEWLERLKNRPILTGSILRPTLYNPPLPRMKPQPIHISAMIYSRRKARERRMALQDELSWNVKQLHAEHKFEANLYNEVRRKGLTFERVYDDVKAWEEPLQERLRDIHASYERESARSKLPYTLELLETVKDARRMRIENKTRERARERRGEVLPITLERMRGQPPAYLMEKMTPRQREIDRIKRLPSEGGYTGRIKSEAGMKLKDDWTWRLEETGDPARQEDLKRLEEEFRTLQKERQNKERETPKDGE